MCFSTQSEWKCKVGQALLCRQHNLPRNNLGTRATTYSRSNDCKHPSRHPITSIKNPLPSVFPFHTPLAPHACQRTIPEAEFNECRCSGRTHAHRPQQHVASRHPTRIVPWSHTLARSASLKLNHACTLNHASSSSGVSARCRETRASWPRPDPSCPTPTTHIKEESGSKQARTYKTTSRRTHPSLTQQRS